MITKTILLKPLRLQIFLDNYNQNKPNKQNTFEKFEHVWGSMLANHFLSKYLTAEELITNLDAENFQLFIDKF